MADSALDTDIETSKLREKATDTWMVWSMDMMREHQEMRAVAGAYNSMFGQQAYDIGDDAILVEASINSSDEVSAVDGEESSRIITKVSREYLPSVRAYLGAIQDWQMNPSRRDEITARLKANISDAFLLSDNYV